MRKLIVFVSIAIVGFGGGTLRRRAGEPGATQIKSAVDVRQLTVDPSSISRTTEQAVARVLELDTIRLNSPLKYFSDFKLDEQGNVYFQTVDPETARARVLRRNLESQQWIEINISFSNGKQTPDSAVLQSYDVDKSGNLYMAIAKPEALLIQDARGKVLSEIDLPDFLPAKISVDAEGNMWVGGCVFLSRNPVTVADVDQIRVYSPTGNLLSIPADGFDKDDLMVGRFTHSADRSELIASARIYDFKSHALAGTVDYPFKINQWNRRSADKQSITQPRDIRMVLGFSSAGKNLMTYGVLPDDGGRMRNGFVALISRSGEALTPELLIPPEYGHPVAAASNGNVYCLRKVEEQLVLTRIRLIDLAPKTVR